MTTQPPTVDLDALAKRVRDAMVGKANARFNPPEVTVSPEGVMVVLSKVSLRERVRGEVEFWRVYRSPDGRVSHIGIVTSAALAALRVLVDAE